MIDGHGRRIDYLRVSVTERCNYRCFYCMPDGAAPCPRRSEIGRNTLTTAELLRLVALFATLGVHKVRLTGGEPQVRRVTTRWAPVQLGSGSSTRSRNTSAPAATGCASPPPAI